MKNKTINKIAAIAAIVSGLLIIISTFLILPSFSLEALLNVKFIGGIVFLVIGILSLRGLKA